MTYYDYDSEISPLGQAFADAYFAEIGKKEFPVDPEIIAAKFFGLNVYPEWQVKSTGAISGIDATQSVIFIDAEIYMADHLQHISRQAIAHELAHIIYDLPTMRSMVPATPDQAFEIHTQFIGQNNVLETRANMLAGCLLVPRRDLLEYVAELLGNNLESLQLSNPEMKCSQVLSALAGSKVANHFGVSNDVITWRIDNERLYDALGVDAGDPITAMEIKTVTKMMKYEKPKALTERVLRLVPPKVQSLIN